ncbi:MAG: GSU2403 family nucleotidyltransferase fold protein [Planctomycetota bacterium]|nr:GSU2403 family nucleotidyltransferase fold protein [Planctomycetota bacterium]
MTPENELLVKLARAIAVAPDRFVVIGGAAHQLFRRAELAQDTDIPVLRTTDADVAVDVDAALPSLRVDENLRTLGIREELSGEATSPVTRYVLESAPEHYIEFVARRPGSGQTRSGANPPTKSFAGVVVQLLSHVDLLLAEPWRVELREEDGFAVEGVPLSLQIVNPASYLAQKLLVLEKRGPDERAKDIVYIHDTLVLFAPHLEELNALWRKVETPSPKRARKTAELARALGAAVGDDVRNAAQLLRAIERPYRPDARALVATLNEGLRRVFSQ